MPLILEPPRAIRLLTYRTKPGRPRADGSQSFLFFQPSRVTINRAIPFIVRTHFPLDEAEAITYWFVRIVR